MNTVSRLTAYTAALALAFAAAWGVGSAVATAKGTAGGTATEPPVARFHGAAPVESAGLAATSAGYTLVPQRTTFVPGEPAEFAFTISGSDGSPVTGFDLEHERRLHLIVVRRDTAGFQHLHPALGPDGVWRAPLALPAAGVYRALADLVPTGGPHLVLGTDLFAPGEFTPIVVSPSRVAQLDGYQVRLDGELVAGGPSQVFVTISRDGAAVPDLEPYLGAFGHLVALRQNDLTYVHVHPDGAPPAPTDRAGPGVAFTAEVPTAGRYRLFLDFQHGGVVRTAEFTVSTASTAGS